MTDTATTAMKDNRLQIGFFDVLLTEAAANDPRFLPYHGWHDDHRHADRTPQYMPAIQQNRAEFVAFAAMLAERKITGAGRSCLQLGLGTPGGSHLAFAQLFETVVSIDKGEETVASYQRAFPGANIVCGNTTDAATWVRAAYLLDGNLDLLFIDAGHRYEDVRDDYNHYKSLVRPGGIIAMHDAVKRPGYEDEIRVWEFVEALRARGAGVRVIGDEIGIAYIVKE